MSNVTRGPRGVLNLTPARSERAEPRRGAPAATAARRHVKKAVEMAAGPSLSGWPCAKYVRRRPTLPQPLGCSTIGAEGLNFRVRDGTGCFPFAMAAVTLADHTLPRFMVTKGCGPSALCVQL